MDIAQAIGDFERLMSNVEGPINFVYGNSDLKFELETVDGTVFSFEANSVNEMIDFFNTLLTKLQYLDDVINGALSEIIIN